MKHAIFDTLPGRAIVIGASVKVAAFVLGLFSVSIRAVEVIDSVASVALVAGGLYFLVQGLSFARQRLLWRVRRKLIISYIFIGFVPAILIVAFFLLGGLLLFSNFSAYLVQNRLRTLADRAASIAETTAVDVDRARGDEVKAVLDRRQAAAAKEFPGLSIALLRRDVACTADGASRTSPGRTAAGGDSMPVMAGPWAHVSPPADIPEWVPCDGFKGVLAAATGPVPAPAEAGSTSSPTFNLGGSGARVDVLVRSVRFLESARDRARYALVLDLPVDQQILDRMRRETGVALTGLESIDSGIQPLVTRRPVSAPGATGSSSLPLTSVAFLDYTDWATGRDSALRAGIRMNVGEIYDRIAAAEGAGRYFGKGLLLVLVVIGVLFLMIEALALVVGLMLARSITGSVHQLFVGTERVQRGDFTYTIPVHADDQLGALARSFNRMTTNITGLMRVEAEKKRLEEELRIAHEIQMSLLPRGPLGMPGLSVTALCVPAREVGGDYYDFLPLDDHSVGVLIADVSGKGTSAAFYMAELKGLMLSLSRIHRSPRELLIAANRIIAEHLDARSFITMTYAVLDLRARTMTYARAGHTPLIYLPSAGSSGDHVQTLVPDGLVLGLKIDNGEMFERLLQEETIAIRSGDLFVLFTDGITEAMDAADDCFGEARLGEVLEKYAHLPSEELRERLLGAISAFVGEAPQHDDMTMMLLRVGEPAKERAADAEIAEVAGVR